MIGWYIHHHGGGHLGRFLAVRPHLDTEVVCFSSLPEPLVLPPRTRWVRLESDDTVEVGESGVPRDPRVSSPTAGGLLHWAPLGHRGHASRLGRIAQAVVEHNIGTVVVDVSVEVTLFVRLLGAAPVVFAQPGVRTDEPHALGYRAATPETRWTVVGVPGAGPENECWVDDPWPQLTGAEVVVSWAGQGSVADLAVAGARAIVIPQPRPFDEQRSTARALDAAGCAVVVDGWPDAQAWPELLGRARRIRPRWERWCTEGAAARAAAAIDEVRGVPG